MTSGHGWSKLSALFGSPPLERGEDAFFVALTARRMIALRA
jgi:hypothetical protein